MKIGVLLESFKKPFAESVKRARALKLDGIQTYSNGDSVHAHLTHTQIQEIKRIVNGEGLVFSALCGDFGCQMFYQPELCLQTLEMEKSVLGLALELGTPIVTTHIGVVPENTNCSQYETMHRICKQLADFADSIGGHFAVETGPEKATLLKGFLDNLQSKGVSVNFDPANLVMYAGDDPVEAVYTLKEYIVHTHAKDGIQHVYTDTKQIYAAAYYNLEPFVYQNQYEEVPLGQGNVDWKRYIQALRDIHYDGFLTIERECGETPDTDIAQSATFLREILV